MCMSLLPSLGIPYSMGDEGYGEERLWSPTDLGHSGKPFPGCVTLSKLSLQLSSHGSVGAVFEDFGKLSK